MASFETLVARLADLRGWDAATIAGIAGGDLISPAALRRLASALGWRPSDLFALAQQDLPHDLAPTDWAADTGRLVWAMSHVPAARPILLATARSLPQLPRTDAPARSAGYPGVPGAVIGILLTSRNIGLTDGAKLLPAAGGPLLAASTIKAICVGRKALDAQIVTGFARALGIPVEDLAAVCAVRITEPLPAPEHVADLADMLWECRRLTREQIDELGRLAHELRRLFPSDIDVYVPCPCRERF